MQEVFQQQQPIESLPLSIVVPCFNEEMGLQELVRRCCESAAAAVGDGHELILVDDGSTDGTWQAITSHIHRHKNIVAIKLSRNFGHQVALTAGLSAAKGRAVFVVDADLQDPPELLSEMLKVMKDPETVGSKLPRRAFSIGCLSSQRIS
jgi:glycosyltransferase involved in cell wall biosynthesis